MKNTKAFVTEVEAELLAKKHLEAFVAECRCQNKQDILRALKKWLGWGCTPMTWLKMVIA